MIKPKLSIGVYRPSNKSTESLWKSDKGRPIFRAILPLKKFKTLSRAIKFDNRNTCSERRLLNKLESFHELWNKWIDIIPKFYNVTADEQLVAYNGRWSHILSKPTKYGIKFRVLCTGVLYRKRKIQYSQKNETMDWKPQALLDIVNIFSTMLQRTQHSKYVALLAFWRHILMCLREKLCFFFKRKINKEISFLSTVCVLFTR